MSPNFVPESFEIPMGFEGRGFRLEPLGPEHNERDYAAWSSSIEHIHATPGFGTSKWPHPMTLQENLADLERHADDFAMRVGFTYSVLDGDDVIGCLYIYPDDTESAADAHVRSWVTAARPEMDAVVWKDVSVWLADHWPFCNSDYATRA